MARIYVVSLILAIYAFIDCAMTAQEKVRRFPKWAWLLIIMFFNFLIGPISWFIFGRPKKFPGAGGAKKRIIPPDDNPDFLRKI